MRAAAAAAAKAVEEEEAENARQTSVEMEKQRVERDKERIRRLSAKQSAKPSPTSILSPEHHARHMAKISSTYRNVRDVTRGQPSAQRRISDAAGGEALTPAWGEVDSPIGSLSLP
eukprot:469452-Prymnesium_polylepis.1